MTSQLKEKTNRVSNIVFILTLAIVLINVISLIFPALIASLNRDLEIYVDPFELGFFTIPFLVANAIVFGFLYLHLTKKLPNQIQHSFKFILKFEISRKVAAIIIIILLGGYVVFTAQDLTINEYNEWPDFANIQLAIKDFPFNEAAKETTRVPIVKNFLLHSSEIVFQNIKILPFIASISLLLVTYFFTLEISKKRFAGIISMIILLQSFTFLRYDTVATYSNFWTLFFVLSLYLMYKKWYLSPVSYFLSIFSKLITASFFPMALFFTYRANIPRKKKIRIALTYIITAVVLAGILGAIVTAGENVPFMKYFDKLQSFDMINFSSGLTAWVIQLRFDALILLFILPLTVGLFLVSRKGIPEADSILVLILGIFLLAALLPAFTSLNVQPYRFLPLIVFFAVGVGILLSKKITQPS